MAEALLDLIEQTAADPSISDEVRDWLLEKAVPALCGEVRRLRNESRPADLVGGLLATALPPAPAGTVARKIYHSPATVPPSATDETARRPKTKKKTGRAGGPALGIPVPGLKRAMENAGISSTELSAALSVNKSSVNNWRAGRFAPTHDKVTALAEALGCTEQDLTRPA